MAMGCLKRHTPAVPVAARTALRDPVFPTRNLPAAGPLRVDYDPAVWVRCPVPGEDRTDWRAAVLSVFTADLGSAPAALGAVLDELADADLRHAADFVLIPADLGPQMPALASLDVLDEELMLLEHGDPAPYLAFEGVASRPRPVRSFPGGWRYATSGRDATRGQSLLRAHRLAAPGVHVVGTAFYTRAQDLAAALTLFAASSLP